MTIRAVVVALIAMILVACGGGGNVSSPAVQAGSTYTLKKRCFGGASQDSLEKALGMIDSNDEHAFQAMFVEGRLVYIDTGTQITVESISGNVAKVRIRGQTQSLWLDPAWVLRQ